MQLEFYQKNPLQNDFEEDFFNLLQDYFQFLQSFVLVWMIFIGNMQIIFTFGGFAYINVNGVTRHFLTFYLILNVL